MRSHVVVVIVAGAVVDSGIVACKHEHGTRMVAS
jgi:hypothetical protein